MSVRRSTLAVVAAGLLVLAAAIRIAWPRGPSPLDDRREPEGAVFRADLPRFEAPGLGRWEEPRAQSMGAEWIFEIFTPPRIHFDPRRAAFVLRPPLEPEPLPEFGLELKGIERVPYRLQYVGHHGTPGRYIVELHDREADAYYRLRPGEESADGGFRLRHCEIGERRVQPPDRPWATPHVERFITLEIFDAVRDETVRLGRATVYRPDPVAVVAILPDGDLARIAPGEELEHAEARFRCEAVDRAAGTATVAKFSPAGELIERRLLAGPVGSPSP